MSTVKKKKAKNQSTLGVGKNTPMLNNINKKANSTKNIEKKLNLPELEAKTKELQIQLDNINSEIEKERQILIEEKTQLDSDLTEMGFEISDLSSKNKELNNELKKLKFSLDNKMEKGKKFLSKMEKLKKEEEKLNKDIEIKDKQISLAEKSQIIQINDYNHIKNIADKNEGDKENELSTKLENLEKDKRELEDENLGLRKIIKDHKICPKTKSNLLSKLNLITNSYQFEKKKVNMLESKMNNLEERKEQIKIDNQEKKEKINPNNKSISYGNKLRKRVLKKIKEENEGRATIPVRAKKIIGNICNTIENKYIKSSGDIKIMKNYDYRMKQNVLFTQNEQLQLANIVPTSILNEFKQRFEAVENQRYQLAYELKKNQNSQDNIVNSVKIKLNYGELKKREQKLLYIDLNSKLVKKNVNIMKLKSDMNKIKNEYNEWNKLLKKKNNENKKLNKHLMTIGKNREKKEVNLKKENNMNFGYNMKDYHNSLK